MIGGYHRSSIGTDQIAKQPQFCIEVMRDIRMVIHVIAREIGEGAGADADAVQPILVEAMRRGLEREMRNALACDFIELTMQRNRIRRGQRSVDGALRRYEANGADTGGCMP